MFSTSYDLWQIKNNTIKRTQSDNVLKEKAFNTESDPKYDGYQKGLASMVYKFFGKKSTTLNKSCGSSIVNEPNYQFWK